MWRAAVLHRVVLDVHPLDPCRVNRAPLRVLHNDHVSVSCNIIASCLSTNLGTMVKEAVSVSEGSPTLGGGGVRNAGPEDSRTCIHKPSSSRMATEIASWMVVSTGIVGGGGVPTGIGWGAGW